MASGHMVTGVKSAQDCIVPQNWEVHTDVEHDTWKKLYNRQREVLQPRACKEYLDGLDALGIVADRIPIFDEVNERLHKLTGWVIVPVPGLIPSRPFFDMLSARQFPVGNFIRKPEEMDYLEEPDVFHDLFGHVPLLTNPVYADYMQEYGRAGDAAMANKGVKYLARLNWWTIEFGLIRTDEGLRIYGAGIASSYGETMYALDDPSPNHLGFDLERVLRTGYYIDDLQATYFVVDSFESLFEEAMETPFVPLYEKYKDMEQLSPFEIYDTDTVLQKGSGAYWKDFPNTKTKLK